MLPSSVHPDGIFRVGIHTPSYNVINRRENIYPILLGTDDNNNQIGNNTNFVQGDVFIEGARTIYEIRNPLPFRGCTYIDSGWAKSRATEPQTICITKINDSSFLTLLQKHFSSADVSQFLNELPPSLQYSLAQNSNDSDELVKLAKSCCTFLYDENNKVNGLKYVDKGNRSIPEIKDFELFETIANNPALPDEYKRVMVLRPGVQGNSEIVGDFFDDETEIFEYLRGNSYIPWGHYAANLAHTSIRYKINELTLADMHGLRHLYYQRMYILLAQKFCIDIEPAQRKLNPKELEKIREKLVEKISAGSCEEVATLWGWNFGYDFSGSGYRLHASHQMIHQQYAMVPAEVETVNGASMSAFSSGDMVADFIEQYRHQHRSCFFSDYIASIHNNSRVDGKDINRDSLVVWEDENVILFVPKAQVSQWELQLMVTADGSFGPVGNIIEAEPKVRTSLDKGILIAQKVLESLGAKLVTSIEYSKRIGRTNNQRLLYSFLPKLPWSMGAFSEAHQRYICGHYPEDFAFICREQLNHN